MPEYKLTLGSQADLTLNRIAEQEHCNVSDVLVRAVNTYATLLRYRESGVFVRERNAAGTLVVKRIAVP